MQRSWNPADDPDKEHVTIAHVIPLAGVYLHDSTFDSTWSELDTQEAEHGGLQLKVEGGKYANIRQRAFINFECDPASNDDEGDKDKRDEDLDPKKKEHPYQGDLQFVSYSRETEQKYTYDTLRLNWKSPYACADYVGSQPSSSSGWGFFTWLVVM